MFSIETAISLIFLSIHVVKTEGFLHPLSSTFRPLSLQTQPSAPGKLFMSDFFDEEFDEDDEDEEDELPQKPAPPSYPDPFGTSSSGNNPFTTTSSSNSNSRTIEPSDKEDRDLTQIATTPMDEYIPKLNIVTLHGRLGQDPNPRYFEDGKVVLNLSLACKRKYHPLERQVRNIKSGEEETDWFGLELWGRDAEYATKFVSKGMRVGVTGSLVIDSYTDKMSGEPRTSARIVVKHFDILETRAESELRRNNSGRGNYNNNYRGGNDNDDGNSNASAGSGGFFD